MQALASKFMDIIGGINNAGGLAGAAGVVLMSLLVALNVIMRKVFGVSLLFAEEVTGYLQALIVFLSLGYCLSEGGHLKVSFIVERLGGRWQRFLAVWNWLIAAAWGVVFLWGAWYFFATGIGTYTSSWMRLPLWMVSWMPVAGGALFLLTLLGLAGSFLGRRPRN